MLIILFVLNLFAGVSFGIEIESKYITISYDKAKHLQKFNNKLKMGRMSYLLKGRNAFTVEDEVKNKLDLITEKVCKILDMHPRELKYSIKLFIDKDGVKKMFIRLHGTNWENAGFYHAPKNTIYISVNDTKLGVITHEIGHVIVKNYFKVSPPVKIHELLAQFAEKHITD